MEYAWWEGAIWLQRWNHGGVLSFTRHVDDSRRLIRRDHARRQPTTNSSTLSSALGSLLLRRLKTPMLVLGAQRDAIFIQREARREWYNPAGS